MIESKRFGSKKALIDIDETICFYGEKRAYELAEPNFQNIENFLTSLQEIQVEWKQTTSTIE
jgi:hypothetical protein